MPLKNICYTLKILISERCLLRTSCHDLRIETGRYTKPHKTPLIDGTCLICNNSEIEDEFHFITSCILYDQEREKLKLTLKFLPSFSTFKKDVLFYFIMTGGNNDSELCPIICKFIEKCFDLRTKHFQ